MDHLKRHKYRSEQVLQIARFQSVGVVSVAGDVGIGAGLVVAGVVVDVASSDECAATKTSRVHIDLSEAPHYLFSARKTVCPLRASFVEEGLQGFCTFSCSCQNDSCRFRTSLVVAWASSRGSTRWSVG